MMNDETLWLVMRSLGTYTEPVRWRMYQREAEHACASLRAADPTAHYFVRACTNDDAAPLPTIVDSGPEVFEEWASIALSLAAIGESASVSDLGAVGDNEHDDAEAMQRAIDVALEIGTTLYMPPGVLAAGPRRIGRDEQLLLRRFGESLTQAQLTSVLTSVVDVIDGAHRRRVAAESIPAGIMAAVNASGEIVTATPAKHPSLYTGERILKESTEP